MPETLEIQNQDGVATIWMNRPEVHNAFNEILIAELTAACRELAADPLVRVVVLAGRGRSFSAGGDIQWMERAGRASLHENLASARALAAMLRTLAGLPRPTIARVHGAALGGGMGLAAACDICVASTDASFATSEVKLGLIPSAIGPYVIRALGARQASRYFLTAERMSAKRAAELGLVHELAEPDKLDNKVAEIVASLLAGGPVAQVAAKHLIRDIAGQPLTDALEEDTAHRIAELRSTPEAQEGLAAFLAKRPAAWVPHKP